jgi:hypothetical protein
MLPEVRTVTAKDFAALFDMVIMPSLGLAKGLRPRLLKVSSTELSSFTPLPMIERLNCLVVEPSIVTTQVFAVLLQLTFIGWFRLIASTRASWHMLTIVRAARLRFACGIHFINAVPEMPAKMAIIAKVIKISTNENPFDFEAVCRSFIL